MIPHYPTHICEHLQNLGHAAYCVGGSVRDTLMGREAHDWDIATSALPGEVNAAFPRVAPTGLQHGTVSVIFEGEAYEVTTFRSDGDYSDGRRPDGVRFVKTIEEDLARRDFTINAIAFDPVTGDLVDPFGGQGDIKDRVIRCVGVPGLRFGEDGLRLMRAARFSAVLGFTIEPGTLEGMYDARHMINGIAVERVTAELCKLLMAPVPSHALQSLADLTILERVVPEFAPMYGCGQNRYHGYDVWRHTLAVIDACPSDLIVRLAALFHDVDKPTCKGAHPKHGDVTFYNHEDVGAETTDAIMRRMKFSTETRERVVHLVRHHLVKYERGWAASAIRRWVRKVGRDNVDQLLALARADILGKGPAEVPLDVTTLDHLAERLSTLQINLLTIVQSTTELAISGRDVMEEWGIGPGPQIGAALRELLELVTDRPELNEREALLGELRQRRGALP
jgi:tRNA nucleotidyltransferase (CCA-adding enzyme)